MKYDPAIHHRRSTRLTGYGYFQAGAYFVTLCTCNRRCLFGQIENGQMRLNDAGQVVRICWNEIPTHFPHVKLDEFVVMPNHVHTILHIVGSVVVGVPVGTDVGVPVGANVGAKNFSPLQQQPSPQQRPRSPSKTIGSVVRGFKIGVTRWMRQNTFAHEVWQRNYWDHIVWNEPEINRIRQYIRNNPTQWETDRLYDPARDRIAEPSLIYPKETWMI